MKTLLPLLALSPFALMGCFESPSDSATEIPPSEVVHSSDTANANSTILGQSTFGDPEAYLNYFSTDEDGYLIAKVTEPTSKGYEFYNITQSGTLGSVNKNILLRQLHKDTLTIYSLNKKDSSSLLLKYESISEISASSMTQIHRNESDENSAPDSAANYVLLANGKQDGVPIPLLYLLSIDSAYKSVKQVGAVKLDAYKGKYAYEIVSPFGGRVEMFVRRPDSAFYNRIQLSQTDSSHKPAFKELWNTPISPKAGRPLGSIQFALDTKMQTGYLSGDFESEEKTSSGDYWNQAFVMSINDKDGKVNWTKVLDKSKHSDRYRNLAHYNGTLYAVGEYSAYAQGKASRGYALLSAYNAETGEVLWHHVFGNPYYASNFNDIWVLDGGNLLLGGYTKDISTDPDAIGWIVKVSGKKEGVGILASIPGLPSKESKAVMSSRFNESKLLNTGISNIK